MRSKLLCAIALLGSAAAGAGSAVAADLPVRGAPPAASPAVAALPPWTGFYVGIHGGGGWGHESFDSSISHCDDSGSSCDFRSFTLPPNVNPKGGIFGFQFGYNWQFGPGVGGLEVDFSGADLTGSSTFSVADTDIRQENNLNTFTTDKKIDALASVRGRVGYLIIPTVLLYGTAGIGFGHERISTVAAQFDEDSGGRLREENNATSNLNMFGWVAGAGVEWMFWPGNPNWLLRGEWLHYDFGRVTNATNNPFLADPNNRSIAFDNGNVRTTVDVARAALSFKF